jgi:hypothetical protein
MSIEVIGCQSFKTPPSPKCKVCDDPPHIAVNWQYAQHRGRELRALVEHLKQVKNLKFGQLYTCRLCGSNWVLDTDRYAMTRVPDGRRDLLNEWNDTKLPIEPGHLQVLDAIGGTAIKYEMGRDGVIAIPCAITIQSGERFDPAVVWITRRPPIDNFVIRTRLYRNVKAVEPSRFTLPMDIRRATVLAPEVSMGFAPTRVMSPDGTPFAVHWATLFFNKNGVTGSEIRLSARRFRKDESITVADSDFDQATYFLADWFEGADKLDKIQAGNTLGSRLRAFWKRLF